MMEYWQSRRAHPPKYGRLVVVCRLRLEHQQVGRQHGVVDVRNCPQTFRGTDRSRTFGLLAAETMRTEWGVKWTLCGNTPPKMYRSPQNVHATNMDGGVHTYQIWVEACKSSNFALNINKLVANMVLSTFKTVRKPSASRKDPGTTLHALRRQTISMRKDRGQNGG